MDKVIYRIYPDGQVIALFPQIAASISGSLCKSYMHIGQHGATNIQVVTHDTRLATADEYAELNKELEQIGYNPKPMKRCTYKDYQLRTKQYKSLKLYEVLVPTHSYTVFRVMARSAENAVDKVSNNDVDVYDTIDVEFEPSTNLWDVEDVCSL